MTFTVTDNETGYCVMSGYQDDDIDIVRYGEFLASLFVAGSVTVNVNVTRPRRKRHHDTFARAFCA